MSSKSVLAIGMDPDKGTLHFYMKTGDEESKRTIPLGPQHMLMLQMVKSMVGGL